MGMITVHFSEYHLPVRLVRAPADVATILENGVVWPRDRQPFVRRRGSLSILYTVGGMVEILEQW